MCLKGLIGAVFESSEPLHLLRLNGRVQPSLHRESTDSLISFILHMRTIFLVVGHMGLLLLTYNVI